MKIKRLLSFLLVLVLIASMVPAMQSEAEAYTTAPTISAGTLEAKIDKLSNLLEGKYFTTTQKSCGNNVCDACMNTNVFASAWFKELFGELSVSQIPGHAYPYGESGTAAGWTCHGFANFAQWYLFSTKNTDKVTNYRVVDNVTLTRANMLKYAKPGDIIRYTYNISTDAGHSVIFLSANENNFTVIDNNFRWNGDAKSCVRTHTIEYDSSIPMAISRASNYPTVPVLTLSFNVNGGTVEGKSDEVVIDTEMLRIRNTASLSGTVLGMIPNGTIVKIQETKTAEGYTWGKVTYQGITGWSALTGFTQPLGYYLKDDLICRSGDSKVYTQTWNYGSSGTLLTASALELSKEGFRFLGWSASPDGTTEVFDPSDTSLKAEDICPAVKNSDQSLTLYAVWEDLNPAVLTFTYHGNGASGTMLAQEAQKGGVIKLTANQFYREGDSFLGWNLQRGDGLWYTDLGWVSQKTDAALLPDGAGFTLNEDFEGSLSYTLYAVWKNDTVTGISVKTPPTKNQYTLYSRFDPAGMIISVHYQDGSSAELSTGYTVDQITFTQLGLSTVAVTYLGFTAYTTVMVYEPPVLSLGSVSGYAEEVVTIPVIYGGNANAECYGFAVTLTFHPAELLCKGYSAGEGIRDDHIQINLAQQGQVTIVYNSDAPIPANTTVLQVHLQIKGQSQESYSVVPTEAVCYDRMGRTGGMETSGAQVINRGMLTVRYDAGQGTNAPASVEATFGQQLQVSTQIPVREGYTFAGWAIYTNADAVYYQGGDMITCLADTVLYATWKKSTVQIPTLTLNYPTVSFEDQIQYNVYYTVANGADIAEMGLIIFNSKRTDGTIMDAVQVICDHSHSGDTYMVHTNGIPSKNLGDTLYFKVYAKLTNGTYVYSDVAGYNAVAYAKTVLSSTASSMQAKSLVVAMLNYGAAAQVHFGYKTDALMNDFLSEAGKALVLPYDSAMMDAVVAADSARAGHFVMDRTAFTGAFPTVSFEGAFSINYYFTTGLTPDNGVTFCCWDAQTYENADKLTTSNAKGIGQMVCDDGRWFACVDGIAAKDMDRTIYVAAIYKSGGKTYTTSVIAYSLGKYCQSMADSGNAFGAATAVYGYYAKAYFS